MTKYAKGMTNDEIPNDEGMTKHECRRPEILEDDCCRRDSLLFIEFVALRIQQRIHEKQRMIVRLFTSSFRHLVISSFVFRASFVIGYFVIRHSS